MTGHHGAGGVLRHLSLSAEALCVLMIAAACSGDGSSISRT
jgi:hypothetical protein